MNKGRKKLTKVESKNREYARKVIAHQEAERDFHREMGAESRKSEREKLALRDDAFQRVRVWSSIDAISEKVNAARSTGNVRLEEALKAVRKERYAALNAIPPVGYTRAEWLAKQQGLKVKPGRPALGVDTAYSRTIRGVEEARKALQAAVAETGERPAPLSEVIKKISSYRSGRPKNLLADDLRNRIDALDAEIQYIVSGCADRDRRAWIAERMRAEGVDCPSELSGRPFVPLSTTLEERLAKRALLGEEYMAVIARLTPSQRRKHQARTLALSLSRFSREASNDEREPAAAVRKSYALALARAAGKK